MVRLPAGCTILALRILPVVAILKHRMAPSGAADTEAGQQAGAYIHSGDKLAELAQNDFDFAQKLRNLVENHEHETAAKVLTVADMYLEDFMNSTTTESRSNVTAHHEQCVKNPIWRFKLLRRVAALFRILQRKEFADVENMVKYQFQDIGPAVISGSGKAMDAILQIHFDYNLNVTELAAGKLGGIPTGAKLLAFHCLQIGVRAQFQGKYALTVDWLKESIRLGRIDGTVDIPSVQVELLKTIADHNWHRQNGGLYDHNLFTRPLKSSFVGDKEELRSNVKAREALEKKYAGKGRSCSYWPMNKWVLCSGKNLGDDSLFCWLEFKAHKLLTIGALKMEFLSRNPDIVQIYDAFSAGKASANIAKGNDGMASLEAAVSSSGFSNSASALEKIGGKFQTSEFLAGAPSDIQVDALPQEGVAGLHDATLILNLKKPDAGGYTVFPAAKATSIPRQGSAIFWLNTLSDGSADFSTAHAHCPVILGQKLVAHKWLSFSHGKCLLQPKERFRVLVNGKSIRVPRAFQHQLITEREYNKPKPFMALEGITEYEYYQGGLRKYAYGSMPCIRRAIWLDWEIYMHARQMARENPAWDQSYPQIHAYLQDFNDSAYNSLLLMTNEMERNEVLASLAWNPLAIYRTMWRLENYVKNWIELDQNEKLPRRLTDYIQLAYNASDGPTYKDLEYSIIGILVMQQVYDFKPHDISRGVVDGMNMGIQLSAQQCLEFGRLAIMQEFYYIGVEWMETTVAKAVSDGRPEAELSALQMELEMAKKAHDMTWRRTDGKDFSTYTQPVSDVNHTSKSLRTNKEVQYNTYKTNTDPEHSRVNYYGVCQGKPHQTVREQSRLFCWYETEAHPYWKVGPLKAELLSMYPKPEIVQFHDILNKRQIQYLRNDSNKERDFLLSMTKDELNPVERLGATLWHFTNSSQESLKIMKTVEKATGLIATEKQRDTAIQIATYAPGSHFSVHPDTVQFGTPKSVQRIATFMFYLNEVKKGGATAFAEAGVHVQPLVGSGIFWYNLYSDGDLDYQTQHGSCPVIFGEKHVATQWLHFPDQDHLRCSFDEKSRIEILVNGKSKYSVTSKVD